MEKVKGAVYFSIAAVIILSGLMSCETDSSDNGSSSSIAVAISPIAGSTLNSSSTIVGTLQYSIKNYDAVNMNYIAKIWFKKSSGYGSSNTSFSSSYVTISSSSGSATLTYAISNEYGDATFVKPIVVKYSLNAYSKSTSINSIDWDASCLAVSSDINFN
jgi:hypothetical protein